MEHTVDGGLIQFPITERVATVHSYYRSVNLETTKLLFQERVQVFCLDYVIGIGTPVRQHANLDRI